MDEREVSAIVGRVDAERIRIWTARGWVRPDRDAGRPRYREVDVARVALVCHLTEDMELDEEQVPPVLALIDQVHDLRLRLKAVLAALEGEGEAVRRKVGAALGPGGGADTDGAT